MERPKLRRFGRFLLTRDSERINDSNYIGTFCLTFERYGLQWGLGHLFMCSFVLQDVPYVAQIK